MFKSFYRAKEISFQLHSKLLSDESSDCMNSIRIRNFHNVHDLPLTRESYSLCNEFLSLEQGEKNKHQQMLLHKQNKNITFNTIAGIHGLLPYPNYCCAECFWTHQQILHSKLEACFVGSLQLSWALTSWPKSVLPPNYSIEHQW